MSKEFITLNYYYNTNSYDIQTILTRGFQRTHKTNGSYGFGIYLTNLNNNNISVNNSIVTLQVDIKNIDNILFVRNLDSLIYKFIRSQKFINEFERTGIITPRLAKKYIEPFIKRNDFNGLKIIDENLLILYNEKEIRNISLFNPELKTLRIYSAPVVNKFIIDDTNEIFTDENNNKITYG